jgi:hypothetical protein
MVQPVKKINRTLGRLLAALFGLTLFLEVACLPLVSTFALQVEKSLVAECNEQDEKEAERTFEFFESFSPAVHHDFEELALHSAFNLPQRNAQMQAILHSEPTFLMLRSLRL